MFDVDEYYAQMSTRLNACRGQTVSIVAEGPHTKASQNGGFLRTTLNIDIEWATGEFLEVSDYWQCRSNEVRHEFSYQFMDGDKTLIFRLDSHGQMVKHGDPCHIHIPGGIIIQHGDPRLNGFSLTSTTFLEAWDLVQRHVRGERFPWEL